MEILPKPIGVMTSIASSTDNAQINAVALSGLAGGFSGLTPGMTYYATTSGKLVTDGTYYGRDGATSSSGAVDGFFYVTDEANKVIVSADSQVGIAVSTDTLALTWI